MVSAELSFTYTCFPFYIFCSGQCNSQNTSKDKIFPNKDTYVCLYTRRKHARHRCTSRIPQINCDSVVDTAQTIALCILYPSPVYVIYGRLTHIIDIEFIDTTRFIWRELINKTLLTETFFFSYQERTGYERTHKTSLLSFKFATRGQQ